MILTTTNFIKIKKTARKLTFWESKNLVENSDTDFLRDFVRRSHETGSILTYSNRCEYYGKRKDFCYNLYVTHIVRRDKETGEQVIYELPADTIA